MSKYEFKTISTDQFELHYDKQDGDFVEHMKIPQELKNYTYNKYKYNSYLEELEELKTRSTKITTVLSDMPMPRRKWK